MKQSDWQDLYCNTDSGQISTMSSRLISPIDTFCSLQLHENNSLCPISMFLDGQAARPATLQSLCTTL